MPAIAGNKLVNKVVCPEAPSGMSYSLRSGLQAAEEDRPDALLVMLADQPFVDAAHIGRLIQAYEEADDPDYSASKKPDGALMPPALLGRRLFAELKLLKGDTGARKLFQSARYRGIAVTASQPELLLDVDDEEGWLTASERFAEQQQQG